MSGKPLWVGEINLGHVLKVKRLLVMTESAPYQLRCKLPTQIVVQLVCVVSHGCQWSGLSRGLGSTFGGTIHLSGSHAMSQRLVSIDPVDLVRGPSFLVGSTAGPTRLLQLKEIVSCVCVCVILMVKYMLDVLSHTFLYEP